MLEIALKVFITFLMLGVEVVGIRLLEGNLSAGIILIILGIIGILVTFFWRMTTIKFFPVKLKVDELAYWYIERDGSPAHSFLRCHEYNFAGEFSFKPRTEVTPTAFYLNLPIGKDVIKVESLSLPAMFDEFGNIKPNDLYIITNSKSIHIGFQLRCESKIQMPLYAYFVMEFERGKIRRKAYLKRDDDYRFESRLMSRVG